MRAFIECFTAYLKSFLPDLGWIALKLLIACLVAGLIGAVLLTPAGGAAILGVCLKAAGIGLAGAALIGLADAIWTCI